MNVIWQNSLVGMARLLMDAANDAGGTGGNGTAGQSGGSLLTPAGGGGGSGNSAGGTPAGDGAAAGGSPPAGASGANNDSVGGAASDWRSQLPKELQESASLRKFTDLSALAGAYVSAEKLIGAKGIPKPGAHSTDQEWANVFKELGLPETVDKYDVKFKEGMSLKEDFVSEFKQNAHKAGILPKQAQALADWFSQKNLASEGEAKAQMQVQLAKQVEGLKTEWGKAFDQNLSRAQMVLKENADPEMVKYLDASGLGNDVNLIKLLAKVGDKMYAEGKIVGESANNTMTPAAAKAEIAKIQGDAGHPYRVKDHPGHKEAVAHMQGLFEMAFGTESAKS